MKAAPTAATGSSAFEWLTKELLETTSLGSLIAGGNPRKREMAVRGTVRLAMKQAGVAHEGATAAEMRAVIERILPALLTIRGVDDAAGICRSLALKIAGQQFTEHERHDELESFLKRAAGTRAR